MRKSDTIQMAHGGGGRLSRDLIHEMILSRFSDGALAALPDAAVLPCPSGRIVFSTDSFVVTPLVFPGGNIGDLAVHGTVNDISVCGGRPRWMSLGLILEEGLPLATLGTVLDSVKRAAAACGVAIVTGDTKVVAHGECDGMYINTAGIGEALPGFDLGPARMREGDAVIVSGSLGDHGTAVVAVREGIAIQNGPTSDTGPVHRLVAALESLAASVHFMRDPTRGGLAAVLNEAVEGTGVGIEIRQVDIPLSAGTKAVSEMLGLDPLHAASEGRAVMVIAADAADEALRRWQALPEGRGARRIGTVMAEAGRVVVETVTGGRRLLDVPQGELLPRIC